MNILKPFRCIQIVLLTVALLAMSPVQARDDKSARSPLLDQADEMISIRFQDVRDFCLNGAVPWATSSKTKLKTYLKLLYRHNWLAAMFNDHDMRVASAFTDANMNRHFGWELLDEHSIVLFFMNIERCRSENVEQLYAALRYILNHHYPGIDTCLTSDVSVYGQCSIGLNNHPTSHAEMREFSAAVQRLNRHIRNVDAQEYWLKNLRETWLTTSTRRSFRRKSAEFDLPVVPVDVVFRHADQIVDYYENLQ